MKTSYTENTRRHALNVLKVLGQAPMDMEVEKPPHAKAVKRSKASAPHPYSAHGVHAIGFNGLIVFFISTAAVEATAIPRLPDGYVHVRERHASRCEDLHLSLISRPTVNSIAVIKIDEASRM